MSLRRQLLVFGLLSLVLPWAGYRYVQEMEALLRDNLALGLTERALTMAATLPAAGMAAVAQPRAGEAPGSAPPAPVHARLLATQPRLDGANLDWSFGTAAGQPIGAAGRLWAGIYQRFLYLSIDVADDQLVYQARPREAPFGDRVILLLRPAVGPPVWRVFATAAPGVVRAQHTSGPLFRALGEYDDRIQAAWREVPSGYALEIRMPVAIAGATLGIAIIDVDPRDGDYAVSSAANWDLSGVSGADIVYEQADMRDALQRFVQPGERIQVIDHRGYTLATVGQTQVPAASSAAARSLLADLVRFILQPDDPPFTGVEPVPGQIRDPRLLGAATGEAVIAWYRGDLEQEAVVVAGVPIGGPAGPAAALLLERNSDAILTATNAAFMQLLGWTFGISVVAIVALLGFATWLSYRVGRLAAAAGTALGPRGEITAALPGQAAADELGMLARQFAELLERLRDYTQYLRSLTGKLSHELRTPLAVVATSAENLADEALSDQGRQFLERMRGGTARLDLILGSMSEATRVEQAIADTPREKFDLAELVAGCVAAYVDVYPDRTLHLEHDGQRVPVAGSPELVAQLLDKLIDNAVSFSAAGSEITVRVARHGEAAQLAVSNIGEPLPEAMRGQLFDSLVSVRARRGDRPHLGLGLYIAALIARFHGGQIAADDLVAMQGVVVTLTLPLATA